MTTHRDLASFNVAVEPIHVPGGPEEQRLRDMESHIDRLYERYHELWDVCEKLSGAVAQDVPLPLKYK